MSIDVVHLIEAITKRYVDVTLKAIVAPSREMGTCVHQRLSSDGVPLITVELGSWRDSRREPHQYGLSFSTISSGDHSVHRANLQGMPIGMSGLIRWMEKAKISYEGGKRLESCDLLIRKLPALDSGTRLHDNDEIAKPCVRVTVNDQMNL